MLPRLETVSPARARTARFRRLSIEGSWIVIGQGAAVAGSLVGVRLMTGLLAPAAYGELALGMTAATLVNQAILVAADEQKIPEVLKLAEEALAIAKQHNLSSLAEQVLPIIEQLKARR